MPPVPWYNSAWRHRMAVTIDHTKVAAVLTNFPWYVRGADILTANPTFWDYVESLTGNDFLWTLDDGTTKIAHAMSHFGPGLRDFESHALIASLSNATDTTRYLYWGNRNAAAQQDAAATFAGHIARWDLGQAAGDMLDTTGAGLSASRVGAPGNVAGQLYATGGASFDGTNDYLTIPADTMAAAMNAKAAIAFSCWFKQAAVGATRHLFSSYTSALAHKLNVYLGTANNVAVRTKPNEALDTARTYISSGALADTASWHYLVAVVDVANDAVLLYLDGAPYAGSGTTTFVSTAFDGTYSAANPFSLFALVGGTQKFTGAADEARLLASVPSADRVLTTYRNQSAPDTFHLFGEIETYPGANLGEHWLMRTRRYP